MPTHHLDFGWSRGNDVRNVRQTVTASGEVNVEETIADDAEDAAIAIAIDRSAVQALFVSCDQDLTIKTNSSSAPDDTLTVKAGVPLVWTPDCGHANPLTEDVTAIYVTNDGGEDATLQISVLQDATP